MTSFANLSANLKLNIQDFSSKLHSASNQVNKFAAQINGKTVEAMRELNKQTNDWGLNLKSVSRVVSGIVISQAFYSILRNVREATSAVWEFTKQLEYAQIAYSNLFNSTSLANEFINVLKDFAAKTPFSFTEAEQAAKRLLAYGIEYKNVMYVMQGVMSAASIQGDSAKIEAISRAFGQIYTYGKLMTQEVRQLSEAGIPAYEILQEELGLTQEQLRNLGNEAIPASVAINALVDGIQKRFGNVTKASSLTLQGIISNIKDNATMLFAGMFEPFTKFVKSGLAELGKFLYAMREIFELKGIGGVFEALFPEELHGMLRQFAANLLVVFQTVMRLVMAVSGLFRPVMEALIRVFNAIVPVITGVVNVLSELIYVITHNATAMKWLTVALTTAAAAWTIFKVKAIATAVVTAVVNGISASIAFLGTVLTFVAAHPFWSMLIGLGAVLIGISGGFGVLGDKINSFFKKITQFNNVDPDKVLLPSQKDRANDLDKFNKKLDGTSDAMDDLADSTGKATKAAKGLLSFDEVFKLNEPDEGTGDGIQVPNIEDLIGDINEGFMPEVPSFDAYLGALTGGFLEKLKDAWDSIKDKIAGIAGTAIGAAFGGLVGKLLGGKLGGVLGLIAGSIVGYFWDKLADYFNLTPEERVNAGIIGGIGAAIGAIIGGILGGPFGAKLGMAIGGFVGSFWGIFAEALGVIPEQHFATVISGALTAALLTGFNLFKSLVANLVPTYIDDVFAGFSRNVGFSFKAALSGALKQGVKGAIVSLGVGMIANTLTAWIADELNLTAEDLENSATGQAVGNIAGSIVGLILGGPIGSLVGGALGQLGGSIIGEFWNYMSDTLKGSIIGGATGLPIGALVGTLVGSIGGPLGAGLGAAIGVALGGIVGLIVDKWDAIKKFFANLGKELHDGAVAAIAAVGKVFSKIGGIITSFLNPIVTVLSDIFKGLMTVLSDIGLAIYTVFTDLASAVIVVLKDIFKAITTVLGDVLSAIITVGTDILSGVSAVLESIFSVIYNALSEVFKVVSSIFGAVKSVIANALQSVLSTVSSIFTKIKEAISLAMSEILNGAKRVFSEMYQFINKTVKNTLTVVSNTFSNMYNSVKTATSNIYNKVTSVFSSMYNTVKNAGANMYSSIAGAFSNIYNSISNAMSNMYNAIKSGLSNMLSAFTGWIGDLWDSTFGKLFDWLDNGISKFKEFLGLGKKAKDETTPSEPAVSIKAHAMTSSGTILSSRKEFNSKYRYTPIASSGMLVTTGHALGGVFNREHIANLNEDDKAEAIIPLEVKSAMQPFVDAVADGLTATLAPMFATSTNTNQLQPLYVGTLIADDRSLKELERRMEVIRLRENRR